MSTFPTLTPSSRTFTPGDYPHSVFAGISGIQGRVRNSNVMLSSQVRLTFAAITESQMLSILTHYQGRQGTFQSFPLPTAIWSGVSSINEYQLSGYGWRYIEPPSVSDAMCANTYDVELTLETVPPEGTAIAGLDFLVLARLVAGSATAQFNLNVAVSLAAGSATADATMLGLDGSVAVAWAAGTATGGSGGDPDFANVSLLLHMDGSNGSTTFTDVSSNALTVTANGNAQISTAQSKFGGSSALFDGSGDFISATSNGFNLGSENFTWEGWLYINNASENSTRIFANNYINYGTGSIYWGKHSAVSGRVAVFVNNFSAGVFMSESTLPPQQTWVHYALVRNGSSFKMYRDGIETASATATGTASNNTLMQIGGSNEYSGAYSLNGYIDDFRITKVARYTANFTPPTAPFPDS